MNFINRTYLYMLSVVSKIFIKHICNFLKEIKKNYVKKTFASNNLSSKLNEINKIAYSAESK